jgi:transposase
MATTIVDTDPITGGVDPHLDVHVAAALDANAAVLRVQTFPTTTARFAELDAWLCSCDTLGRAGGIGRAGPSTAGNGRSGGRDGSPEPAGSSPDTASPTPSTPGAARAACGGARAGVATTDGNNVEAASRFLQLEVL